MQTIKRINKDNIIQMVISIFVLIARILENWITRKIIVKNQLINKLLFTLFAVFISNSAVAEWTSSGVYVRDDYKSISILYVDHDTIRISGNNVKMWHLEDFSYAKKINDINILSYKGLNEYDCKNEQFRELYVLFYSGKMGLGRIVHTNEIPTRWKPIVPGGIGETLWRTVCGEQDYNTYAVSAPLPKPPDWKSPNWMKYGSDSLDYQYFFDPTSIQKDNHFKKVWSLWSGKSHSHSFDKLYPIRRVLYEFDCQREMVRVVSENPHSNVRGEGNEHHLISRPYGEAWEWGPVKGSDWSGIERESYYQPSEDVEVLFNIVCNKKG
ncbi:surface-adhesin E family protein [Nitrosomonas nitrosa]|uniref:surface-adhesin E family protein n=1 Tax=Nitrosomonas nitrosa TaxID=52442 RepID=UPI000D30A8EA|nr:surface-adhesin E family protein [Nitrosomonas nitrosa]